MYVASLFRLFTYLLAFNSFQLVFTLYIATNPPSVNTSLIMLLSLLKSFSNSPLSIRCPSLVAQSVKNLPAMQETACNAGDPGSIPGSGRSPGEGNGDPIQYACLENPMDRGAWWAIGYGVTKNRSQLSEHSAALLRRGCFCVAPHLPPV